MTLRKGARVDRLGWQKEEKGYLQVQSTMYGLAASIDRNPGRPRWLGPGSRIFPALVLVVSSLAPHCPLPLPTGGEWRRWSQPAQRLLGLGMADAELASSLSCTLSLQRLIPRAAGRPVNVSTGPPLWQCGSVG